MTLSITNHNPPKPKTANADDTTIPPKSPPEIECHKTSPAIARIVREKSESRNEPTSAPSLDRPGPVNIRYASWRRTKIKVVETSSTIAAKRSDSRSTSPEIRSAVVWNATQAGANEMNTAAMVLTN